MAWIVGLATETEITAIEKLNFEIEEPSEAVRLALGLVDADDPTRKVGEQLTEDGRTEKVRCIAVYLESDITDIITDQSY